MNPESYIQLPIQATGTKVVVYFPNWAIYSRKYFVWDMDWNKITHINYAFANVLPDGSISLLDPWADTDQRFIDHGDSWNDPNENLFGNFNQLFKFKQNFRHVKVGLSLGGWTLSKYFSDACSTPEGRKKLVGSSIKLMIDLGLDFIDIDWEYPTEGGLDGNSHRPEDGENYVKLLKEFRTQFLGLNFVPQLSVAAPASKLYYRHWNIPQMCQLLDFVNIMTYDFSGSWSRKAGHQSNLYDYPNNEMNISVNETIVDWIKLGCPSEKIVMGMPIYGRSFENTKGLGFPFTSPTVGTWEPGVFDYKKLPLAGSSEYYDVKSGASYSYDSAKKILVSYDTIPVVNQKLEYIRDLSLGGAMFWEISADRPTNDPKSILSATYKYISANMNIDATPNNVLYPDSKYPNIRNSSNLAMYA
ncbi:Glycoside hydrolase, family 18, catalytic domain-containing protein [Rozella allomycis CSF55]|uniref:chitinase n=1 Tax=Rozella allomycis (strain CSF55) TaxID=988480 RepID=A0A075ANN3_ROZAC|nr:Glycoside hydrolase, family 18, catalytic domain-containing protein [Rozella allomycis CSF55]|eukprot:EPZ31515.1 Glycoside hydrolase, family 18, catalytic domain-containing protein [Rozella allomycis CSF55]